MSNHGHQEHTLTCPVCQIEFHPYTRRAKWCSPSCRNKRKSSDEEVSKKLICSCRQCGKEFSQFHKQQVYCSSECREKFKHVYRHGVKERLDKSCEMCGKEFLAISVRFKFCSPECRRQNEVDKKTSRVKIPQNTSAKRKSNNRSVLKCRLKTIYGITIEQYDQILVDQKYKCAIEACPNMLDLGRATHLDHSHTGDMKVRGILCAGCNKGLGHFNDSAEILRSAADYINKHHPN